MSLRKAASNLLLGFSCAGLAAAGPGNAGNVSSQNFAHPLLRPIGTEPSAWPQLTGRVGPYGGINTADDARRMTRDGLGLTVLSVTSHDVLKTLREGGATYIDSHLWRLIFDVCQRQFDVEADARQPLACALSAYDQEVIAKQAAMYIDQVGSDPALVGFWILDDYPHGDVSVALQRIHDLVQLNNARTGVHRPTLCGVGGNLDVKRTATDTFFIEDRAYTEQALRNISPAGCDVVSPYFYGVASADDPRLVDWSMRRLLPYFREALARHGYEKSPPVVVPVAHAFSYRGASTYYVTPRPDDIATQMKAYCDLGAASMLFFTWQSPDADRSYLTDAALRAGVQQGRESCAEIWRRVSTRQ